MAGNLPGVLYSLSTNGQKWKAPGRPDLPAVGLPVFVIGTTYPDATTVGVGIIRPTPSAVVVVGDQTFSTSQTIIDKTFSGLVSVTGGATVDFENCLFIGPLARVSGANIVSAHASTMTTLRYCTIDPQTPTAFWNGIGYSRYTLDRSEVKNVVDGCAAFALVGAATDYVHVSLLGSWIHSLSRFSPDAADPSTPQRNETHNDGIQCQGNIGAPDDILINGTRIDGYHSTTAGQPPAPGSNLVQLSAVMLTPATRNKVTITIKNSWFSGGVFTVNATANANSASTLVMDNNKFEKPHSSTGGPAAAIAIDAALTDRSITNQTYAVDGTSVPLFFG